MISRHDVIASMLSLFTLLVFWFVGLLLSQFISLPASLLGLLALFFFFVCLGRVPQFLLSSCQFLLQHLSLFFISPLIGAWLYADQLGEKVWLFLGVIVATTLFSLFITSWISVRIFKPSLSAKTTEKDD